MTTKEHAAEVKAEAKADKLEEEKDRLERQKNTVAKQKLDVRVDELQSELRGKDKPELDAFAKARWAAVPVNEKAQALAEAKFGGDPNDKRFSVRVPNDSGLPKVHVPAGSPAQAIERYDELLGVTEKEHTVNEHEVILLTL